MLASPTPIIPLPFYKIIAHHQLDKQHLKKLLVSILKLFVPSLSIFDNKEKKLL